MGISLEFVGSMESEINTKHNKDIIGQGISCHVTDAKTETDSDVIIIDDAKASDTAAGGELHAPEMTGVIVIDDAEPEEGEIVNSEDEVGDLEFENISSDEEFTLRQKIEALEARNLELEKIASISARSTDVYGYGRPAFFGGYKPASTPMDDAFLKSTSNRSNILKSIPPLSSVKKKTHQKSLVSLVENISSDEVELSGSENEYPLSNGKLSSYNRQSHRTSKKEKRQSKRKSRSIENDSVRCVHGKRRCADSDCTIFEVPTRRKEKKIRGKYDERKATRTRVKLHYSSDSEDEESLMLAREELKVALNIKQPSNKTAKSTLSHKLSAIQKEAVKKDEKHSAKRKRSKSSETKRDTSSSRKRKRSHERADARQKTDDFTKTTEDSKPSSTTNAEADDIYDDEAISLEEQELRLIALKSAVLKKHEARKKAKMANQNQQSVRPYSPTDSVLVDDVGDRSNDCIDSDNNNMDISPISSPNGNQCQPMDMELASSNESSKSPVFCYEKPAFPTYSPFLDWRTVAVPIPISTAFVDIDQVNGLGQPFQIAHPFPIYEPATHEMKDSISIDENPIDSLPCSETSNTGSASVDNEDDLREQLIRQMRNQISSTANAATSTESANQNDTPTTVQGKDILKDNKLDDTNQDDSLEEDCLRSLLLSSKGKKTYQPKESTAKPSTTASSKSVTKTENNDMPNITSNLKEALKRLKNNQQANKLLKREENESNKAADQIVSKSNDIPKTGTNNRLDKNKNELLVEESKPQAPKVPLKTDVDKENADEVELKKPVAPAVATATKSPAVAKIQKPEASVSIKKENPVLAVKATAATKTVTELKASKTVSTQSSSTETTSPKIIKTDAIPKQAVRTTVATAKKTTPITPSVSPTLTKIEALRKSTLSPTVSQTWTPKPVKKLIITLNANSSSDSDSEYSSDYSSPKPTPKHKAASVDNSTSSSQSADPNTGSTSVETAVFAARLENFLKKVRETTDAKQETAKQPEAKKTTIVKTKKVPITSDQKTEASTKTSPLKAPPLKAVSHLPISSQLEYHRLISRMKQLEKQKEQKSRLVQPTVNSVKINASLEALPLLKVVVQNENRFIQTANDVTAESKEKITVIKTTVNNTLAKQVLVKNTINSLVSVAPSPNKGATVSHQSDAKPSATSINKTNPSLLSSVQKTEQLPNNQPEDVQPTSTSISIAALAKKPPKFQASVLLNYVKRFRAQSENTLNDLNKLHRLTCRAQLETRKQQKLELELEELRHKTKVAEEKLAQQKNLTQRLQPAIAASEKSVTVHRRNLMTLETCCNRLGAIVKGPEYKVKCDKEAEIKEKVKSVLLEKNKLKLLKQAPPKAPITVNKMPTITTQRIVIKANDSKPKVAEVKKAEPVAVAQANASDSNLQPTMNSSIQNTNNKITSAEENTAAATPKDIESQSSEEVNKCKLPKDQEKPIPENHPTPQNLEKLDVPVVANDSIKAEEPQSDKILITEQQSSEQEPRISDSKYEKYTSPLEHLLQTTNPIKPSQSGDDRSGIVCPFELMGRCEDKQCAYQHLPM